MTTAINQDFTTLLDLAKLDGPDGRQLKIVEALSRKCPMVQDAHVMEGNSPEGYSFAQQTGLPSVAWRRFNEGTAPSKSREDVIKESCGILDGLSVIDCSLAERSGNVAQYRLKKDMAFSESFKQTMESSLIYASTKTDPEKLHGFAPRLSGLSGSYSSQVINYTSGQAGSDQTSIWLVGWGPNTVHLVTPKGRPTGLQLHDMGEQMHDDGTGKKFRAYITNWEWQLGMAVEDPRYLVRGCNIDTSAISAGSAGTSLLVDLMTKMYFQLPDPESCRCTFYANKTVLTYLTLQARQLVANSTLNVQRDVVTGKPIFEFMGLPIRRNDQITVAEDVLV